MFIKVKRLQEIQDLLLENDLIQIGNEVSSIIGRESEKEQGSTESDSEEKPGSDQPGEDPNVKMDKLLDWLLSLDEANLTSKLRDPIFRKTFGQRSMKKILESYFKYLLAKIKECQRSLLNELLDNNPSTDQIESLKNQLLQNAARLEMLGRIYEALASLPDGKFAQSVVKTIQKIKAQIAKDYEQVINQAAESTKKASENYENSQAGSEQKDELGLKLVKLSETADILTDGVYDPAEKNGLKEKITAKMSRDELRTAKLKLEEETTVVDIIKSLFNLRYQTFQTESAVKLAVDKIRVRINDLMYSTPDVKNYLYKNVSLIETELLERVKNKSFNTGKFKGIHYDFNKKLPLYVKTPLPVTGKQIADETRIMKFRKISQQFMSFLFPGGQPTEAGAGFQATGKLIGDAFAHTLNWTAKKIGKAIKGREGEMKADALTRLFILDTSVLDTKKENRRGLYEEAAPPGVSPQVPGSISGAGPISAPTETKFGSGDNFGPKINGKKKSKKKGVLDFKSFLEENKNHK